MNDKKIRILVFDKDELSATLIDNYLKEFDFRYEIIKFSAFDKNKITAESEDLCNFIFVDISKDNIYILDEIAEISNNRYNVFFMMSQNPTTDLYVKTLRAGSKEFLRKPIEKDAFIDAFKNNYDEIKEIISDSDNTDEEKETNVETPSETHVEAPAEARVETPAKTEKPHNTISKKSKIVSVTSVEPSCGKTTFAINTAREISELTRNKVLLIDFNENMNNVSFLLDIDHIYDTKYFIKNTTLENAKQVFPKIYKFKNTSLYIMSVNMYKSNISEVLPDELENFLHVASKYFRFIVIDVNINLKDLNKVIYKNSDMVFYIMHPSLTTLSENQNYINSAMDGTKFRIVLNKYKEKDENKLNEMETVLGRQISHKIPVSFYASSNTDVLGKTIRDIKPESSIVKEFNQIAKYIILKV